MQDYTKNFIHILCAIKMPEATIHGIAEMMWDDYPAQSELVKYIEANPQTTESDLLKEASLIMGLK